MEPPAKPGRFNPARRRGFVSEGLGLTSFAGGGGHAVAFEPFVEGGFIDVNPSSNLDHRGVKSIAV
jgi:hypothetical protein